MKSSKIRTSLLTLTLCGSLFQSVPMALANTETTTTTTTSTSTTTQAQPTTTSTTQSTTTESTKAQVPTTQAPTTTKASEVKESVKKSPEALLDYTYAGCVQWVKDRTKALFNYKLPLAGRNKYGLYGASAYWDYMKKAGYKYGQEPAKYALAVWEQTPYKIDGTFNYGHLALVEDVKGDTVTISQGGYWGGKWGKYRGVSYQKYKKSKVPGIARKFLGYIYLKDKPAANKKTVKASPKKKSTATVKTDTVYRVYHGGIRRHLYTKSLAEAKTLGQRGWHFEGAKFKAATKGTAVYRLYHGRLREHLYTTNANEKNILSKNGWRYEGIAWYSSGNKSIYRLYHAGLNVHLYTADTNEKNILVGRGWKYENVAFKVQ